MCGVLEKNPYLAALIERSTRPPRNSLLSFLPICVTIAIAKRNASNNKQKKDMDFVKKTAYPPIRPKQVFFTRKKPDYIAIIIPEELYLANK